MHWASPDSYAEQLHGSDQELRHFTRIEEPTVITNYIKLAMRTNSTVVGQNADVTPDLLHATLGLMSESFEYDMAKSWLNAVEELGDMCWFTALASHAVDHDPFDGWEDYIDRNPDAPLLKEAIAELADHIKGCYAYGKALDVRKLCGLLDAIAGRIAKIVVAKSDRTPDELLMANIEKPAARFPERFEVDLALVRNTKQEAGAMRAVLH